MLFAFFRSRRAAACSFQGRSARRCGLTIVAALPLALVGILAAGGQTATERPPKRVIGATAVISEISTRIPFAARIDTGVQSCSLRAERLEIKDESPEPIDNIGKSIRFLIKNENGLSDWVETVITGVVRIRPPAAKEGDFDRRYKVQLTLGWQDFQKEVPVTLNDRTEMTYPLVIGRNYLRGDFLVDVERDNPD
jgi:hypothetical protein